MELPALYCSTPAAPVPQGKTAQRFVVRDDGRIPRFGPRGAFSLVEVALALGIFSFGMVGMLGLLPIGLKVSRESISKVVESNIVQQITSDAELTDFSNLTGKVFYFDDEGILLAVTDAPSRRLYTVMTTLFSSTNMPSENTVEPEKVAGLSWDTLALMKIDIQSVSGSKDSRFIHIAKLN